MSIQINTIIYDGDLDGIKRYSVRNWSGRIYVIPRMLVSKMNEMEDFVDNPCIYVLKGNKNNQDAYYVGQSDDPINTILAHRKPNEDFWNEAILMMNTQDDKLSKGIVKYLENALYTTAKKAAASTLSFMLIPNNDVRTSPLSPYDEDMALEFLNRVYSISDLFGCRSIFEIPEEMKKEEKISELFIKTKGIVAMGGKTLNGFIVYKGSQVIDSCAQATSATIIELGNQLRKNKIIVDNVFVKDYIFKTASVASSIVVGYNSNGYKLWKDYLGKTLADLENK